jgi:Flp pilus assembly protein CpaB
MSYQANMTGLGVTILFIIGFALGGCTPSERKPELIGIQSVPTQHTHYTATPNQQPTPPVVQSPTTTQTLFPTSQPSEPPSATPEDLIPVVVMVQPVPAGYAIPPQAVTVLLWPPESVPIGHLDNIEQVINEVALVDLPCFEPVIQAAIARREVGVGFRDLPERCPPVPETVAVDVVIANRTIYAGEKITPSMIRLAAWPYAPNDAAIALADVIGTYAVTTIYQEQALTSTRLTNTD